MATNFPTSVDSFTNPTAVDTLDSPPHDQQHADVNDAVEAIETALLDGAPLHIDDANSRVGIGTASPSEPLHVATASGAAYLKQENGTATTYLGPDGSNTGLFGTSTAHDVRFMTGNSERVRIDSSGNVGIGTTTPSWALDVVGEVRINGGDDRTPDANGDGHLMITGNAYTGFTTLDGSAMWVGHNSNGRSLHLATDETARVTVLGTGNVGINDTTPSYKLDVDGDINATGDLRIGGNAIGTWTDWTPTVSSSSGTISSYTVQYARYARINDLVLFNVRIRIVDKGTASGSLKFTVPITPSYPDAGSWPLWGRESATTGYALNGEYLGSDTFAIRLYGNGTPIVNGYWNTVGGIYQVA